MKKIYLLLSALFFFNNLYAQEKVEKQITFCATDGNVPDVLSQIKKSKSFSSVQLNALTNNCYFINVFFHIVRNTNGTGGQDIQVITVIMNNLGAVYGQQNVTFINTGNDEVRNDYYMTNFDNTKFTNLITKNVVSNALNIYLLDDFTWNQGRASGIPGTALVVGGSFAGQPLVSSLVVPHEVGHCLGLYHTFETSNGLELVNETNCTTAGDLVCDTPASSPNYNFMENAQCAWTVTFTDSNGQTYNPDPHNIMAYVRPSCMQYFTNGQGSRCRTIIGSSSTLANVITNISISGPPTVCSAGTNNYTLNVQLPWSNYTWSATPSNLFTTISGTGPSFATSGANSVAGQGTITATLSAT